MSTNTARQPRQTRSSAACDSCRSKKQKCGGEWPVCARCRETGNPCVWPQQLQRGPAKGYLEAIESRLDEVESILLQVLPLLPSEQLPSAIVCHSAASPSQAENSQKRTTQEKRAALEYWSSFPLNSPQAVLVWARDRQRRSGSTGKGQVGGHVSAGLASSGANSPGISSSTVPLASVEATATDAAQPEQDPNGGMVSNWQAQQIPFGMSEPRTRPGSSDVPSAGTVQPADQANGMPPNTPTSLSRSSSTHTSRIDLSDEFQSKFLW